MDNVKQKLNEINKKNDDLFANKNENENIIENLKNQV